MVSARAVALVAVALFFSLAGHAWAQVDLKISQLPAASTLTGAELIACVQGGVSDKCTASQLSTFTLGGTWHGAIIDVAHGGTGTASPSLIAGTNVTITGSWPNQTIAASGGGGSGTVTSVAESFTGGIIAVAGSPITTSGTFALTVSGTSGGVPYFSSGTGWTSSAALANASLVVGGGAGGAPATITLGGDCTFSSPNVTCTKTGGVAFTALATAATPLSVANGGTGATSANAGFNALSPMTTIGDIIYGAASGVATRLANGTTGQFLGANTGAAPSWQTPAGGGSSALSSYTTARYYTLGGTASAAGAAATASVIVCNKGLLYAQLTFQVLTVNITTAGSSNIQSALYADTGGLPGALLSSTPSVVDTGTLGTAMTLAVNVQAGPGAIWFCTNVNDSTVVMTGNSKVTLIPATLVGAVVGAAGLAQLVSSVSNVTGVSCSGANCNGGSSTFGTWPATLVGSTWTTVAGNTTPELYFQPFSVP